MSNVQQGMSNFQVGVELGICSLKILNIEHRTPNIEQRTPNFEIGVALGICCLGLLFGLLHYTETIF